MSDLHRLSKKEMCELTQAHTKEGQIKVLKKNGIRHIISRTGWPSVLACWLTNEPEKLPEKSAWKPRLVS